MRRLLLPFLVLVACGDDDAGGGAAGLLPPGATVAPGELPTEASFIELKGTDVGIGDRFACAITTEKKIICWGETKYQHLLQLNSLGKTAVEVKVPSPPVSLSFSGEVGCAILEDGSLRCFGSLVRGNDGSGKIASPEPGESVSIAGFPGKVDYFLVGSSNSTDACGVSQGRVFCIDLIRDDGVHEIEGGISDAKAVASHSNTHCVVRADAKLYCWGANDRGQLGVPIGGVPPASPPSITTPTLVPDLTDVTDVQVESGHTCAVSKGNVICWGDLSYSNLTEEQRKLPVPKVTITGLANVTKLRKDSDGDSFCAIADGGAYCFKPDLSSPIALKIDEPGATEIRVHGQLKCGVFAEGRIKCWGSASEVNGDGAFAYHPVPTFVPNVTGATKLYSGGSGACIVDKDNHASCWGDADGSNSSKVEAGDGHVQRWPALDNATYIAPGHGYTSQHCGVFGGAIKCAAKPSDTSPTALNELTNVVDFSIVESVGCALLADATISCWREYPAKLAPTVVKNLAGVKAVVLVSGNSATSARPCVLQDGVKCAGYLANDGADFQPAFGTLGTAATDLHSGAMQLWCGHTAAGVSCDLDPSGISLDLRKDIPGTAGASLLAVGAQHACALIGGQVQCWGTAYSGQLGSGNFNESVKAPFPVSNAGVPTALALGDTFSCGLQGDGRVQCWGSNKTGIVSAAPANHAAPTQVRVIY